MLVTPSISYILGITKYDWSTLKKHASPKA